MEKYFHLEFFLSRGLGKLFVWVMLLMAGLIHSVTTQAQTRKCPYCDGNGTIVRHLTVSQYGVRNEVKKKCSTCGIYYYPSSGHSHIHCKYCRGTGRISNTGGSSNAYDSGSGNSSGSYSNDYEAESNPALKAWGQSVALNIRYGLPLSEEEDAAFRRFAQNNPAWAQKYVEWRNTLNYGTMYFNERSAKLGYEPVKSVDSFFKNIENNLLLCSAGITLPQDLYQEAHRLEQIYYNAYQKYRNWCSKKEALTNLENAVLDWRLNQALFGY